MNKHKVYQKIFNVENQIHYKLINILTFNIFLSCNVDKTLY